MAICGYCGDALPDADAIDRHLDLHMPGPVSRSNAEPSVSVSPPPDPAYPYVCELCRARYKTKSGLRNHRDRAGHHPPIDDTLPRAIGIPSGTPTHAMLQLLAATFRTLAERLPPTEVLVRLLTICRRTEGSGRLPPASVLLRKGLLGRAWEAVMSEAAPLARVPEPTGDELRRVIRDLHPEPPETVLPEAQPVIGPAPRINGQAILRELKAMKAVAAGPSGLGKQHLLYLCDRAGAADIFASALGQLLASGDWGKLKPLAEFRLKLLPKPGGKWRPIAVQETVLVAFHRLVLKQTPALRRLPDWQLAFSPLAQVKAITRAEALKREHHLLTVDVRNAFNSVPHPVILFSLRRARVPAVTVDYIASFLAARYSADLPSVPAGVPQGDPLSMAMFCLSLVWPVESFLPQYKVLAYADDMILASEPAIPADKVRDDARAALARVGLSVVTAKCTSTQDGGIAFMGTRILRDAPYNLAEQATRSLHDYLGALRAARLPRHDSIRLLACCVVPSVNYGPLVDAYPGPQSYQEVDSLIAAELGALTGIPAQLALLLALTPRASYGLGLVLPHRYHGDMQRQRQAMRAGTFRELRKGLLKDAAPLRSFLPLALLRGPPLSDDQVLFVGDCLAGRYQKSPPMGTCRHCRQPMLPRHHLVCKAVNGLHVARHAKVMEALLAAARGKTSRIARNPAVPTDHLQPDFVVGDGFGDLVVAVPWRVERSYALKMTKYLPLLQSGRAAHFLPIVVGADGTLHPSTASGLARLGVDLLRFTQEVAIILLWHYDQTAAAYASLPPGEPNPPPSTASGHSARRQPTPMATCLPFTPPLRSPSLSVEIVDGRGAGPLRQAGPPAPDTDEASGTRSDAGQTILGDPSDFQRSGAPSPSPLDEASPAGPPAVLPAEPAAKQLPPIFKFIGTGVSPARQDKFYPFRKLDPRPAQDS